MPATDFQPNSTSIRQQHQSKKGYVVTDSFAAPAAASATNVIASITTAVVTTAGLTNPDMPRVARIASGGATHTASGNVVVNGTDSRGNVVSDTIALNGNTAVDGVVAMKTITSIDTTGVSGIGAASTVTVGGGLKLGLSRKVAGAVDMGILGTADGVYEATRPTFTAHATYSKNVVSFNTAPNGAKNFKCAYVSDELYTGAN